MKFILNFVIYCLLIIIIIISEFVSPLPDDELFDDLWPKEEQHYQHEAQITSMNSKGTFFKIAKNEPHEMPSLFSSKKEDDVGTIIKTEAPEIIAEANDQQISGQHFVTVKEEEQRRPLHREEAFKNGRRNKEGFYDQKTKRFSDILNDLLNPPQEAAEEPPELLKECKHEQQLDSSADLSSNSTEEEQKAVFWAGTKKRGRSDEEKQRIVKRYLKLKECAANKLGKAPNRSKSEQIAAELGVSLRSITEWKTEFEIKKDTSNYIKKQKEQIAARFDELKKQNAQMTNADIAKVLNVSEPKLMESKSIFHKTKRYQNNSEKREIMKRYYKIIKEKRKWSIEEICKKLDISRQTLYRWKSLYPEEDILHGNSSNSIKINEMTKRRIYSDEEKQRKVMEFMEIKASSSKRFGKGKNVEEIATELGVSLRAIFKWKMQFGIESDKINKKEEKKEIVKNYIQIKGQNPQMTAKEIAKQLGISVSTMDMCRKHFQAHYTRAKVYDKTEKIEMVKRYQRIKKTNPEWKDDKITKMLEITKPSLLLWKKKFAEYVISDESSSENV